MALETEHDKVVVTLTSRDPIRGWVGDGTDPARPFTGWLALVSALQEIVAEAPPREAAGERR